MYIKTTTARSCTENHAVCTIHYTSNFRVIRKFEVDTPPDEVKLWLNTIMLHTPNLEKIELNDAFRKIIKRRDK